MNLPDDLNRMPPQVLDVIRFLGTQEDSGAWLDDMMTAMGMSERSVRKWLRRLVTRYYAEMPIDGYYALTANGKQAASTLREYDAVNPPEARVVSYAETLDDDELAALAQAAPEPATPEPVAPVSAAAPVPPAPIPAPAPVPASASAVPSEPVHERRMVLLVPQELVARETVVFKVGLERPRAGQSAHLAPVRAIVRISAPGCDVKPSDRPLDVAPDALSGPLRYEITPRLEGRVRVKVEVFQLVSLRQLVPVGGMYFDLKVAPEGSPAARRAQALAADVRLRVG